MLIKNLSILDMNALLDSSRAYFPEILANPQTIFFSFFYIYRKYFNDFFHS